MPARQLVESPRNGLRRVLEVALDPWPEIGPWKLKRPLGQGRTHILSDLGKITGMSLCRIGWCVYVHHRRRSEYP